MGRDLVSKQSEPFGFKALTPSGTVPVTVQLAPEVVREGEPVLALRQLVPTIANTAGHFAYKDIADAPMLEQFVDAELRLG